MNWLLIILLLRIQKLKIFDSISNCDDFEMKFENCEIKITNLQIKLKNLEIELENLKTESENF